jgi:hypothetical protein
VIHGTITQGGTDAPLKKAAFLGDPRKRETGGMVRHGHASIHTQDFGRTAPAQMGGIRVLAGVL